MRRVLAGETGMGRRWRITAGLAPLALVVAGSAARGGAIEFTDKEAWIAAVGPFTSIGFCEFPAGTFITDQYSELGVLFTDGEDVTSPFDSVVYPVDGCGLNGVHDIALLFDTPQRCIAVDHPGVIRFKLFNNGALIYESNSIGPGGYGNFDGLIALEPFDSAVLQDAGGGIAAEIDDLHFGFLVCPPDLTGDGRVGHADFTGLLIAWGTHPHGPPDLDGDGNVGIVDFLELLASWGLCPFVPDCNGNDVWDASDIESGASQDCNGNDVPDECDIADGTSRDQGGDGVPDECQPPPNDDCEDAIAITEGATPFYTVGATTAGPLVLCPGVVTMHNDVWYVYTPSCTGYATLSLCNGAEFDTVLAVYPAGSCPPSFNPQACSDDAPGCGITSQVELVVVEGIPLLVRVGGRQGGGLGALTVSCEPFP